MLNPAASRVSLLAALLLTTTACATGRPVRSDTPWARAEPRPTSQPVVERDPDPVAAPIAPPAVRTAPEAPSPFPLESNIWIEAEMDWLLTQRASVLDTWFRRGQPYQPLIEKELRTYGLPTDLYYLAMIESGFVPTAKSRVGAAGLWQFMPATGRAMGLRVDSIVDERLDPIRATRAAARHLRDLYAQFGDWSLVAAAYNAGPTRVTRGISGFRVDNFWRLSAQGDFAAETKRYAPRLYAVTRIGRSRAPLPDIAPLAYDSLRTDRPIPLREIALTQEIPLADLERLNPHLLQRTTPATPYWLWIPRAPREEGPDTIGTQPH